MSMQEMKVGKSSWEKREVEQGQPTIAFKLLLL